MLFVPQDPKFPKPNCAISVYFHYLAASPNAVKPRVKLIIQLHILVIVQVQMYHQLDNSSKVNSSIPKPMMNTRASFSI